MSVPRVSASALVATLAQALDERPAAISFDADGTLWAGDVAEDVFGRAVREGLLRQDAHEALTRVARQHGVPESGTPSQIAGRLFGEYVAGRFPERDVCEMMAWCFAGFDESELRELAADTLRDLESRTRRPLAPIMDWARGAGVRVVIVSASPQPIVEVGARLWGIEPADIAGAPPKVADRRLLPELTGPVPYAAAKVVVGTTLLGGARWLAAFGDSLFDLEMLRQADHPVGVAPKPELVSALAQVPGACIVEVTEL